MPPPPPPGHETPQQPYAPPPGYQLKRKKRFYQRFWLFWVPIIILIVIIASVSAAGGSDSSTAADDHTGLSSTTGNTAAPKTSAPKPGVSKGIASKDASNDVKVGKLKVEGGGLGFGSVEVTITNHSSKRSDYAITVALESADGKQQFDTADVFVQNLEPGQSKKAEGEFLELPKKVPASAKLVLQEVERTASL
jgi:hypothetical protein